MLLLQPCVPHYVGSSWSKEPHPVIVTTGPCHFCWTLHLQKYLPWTMSLSPSGPLPQSKTLYEHTSPLYSRGLLNPLMKSTHITSQTQGATESEKYHLIFQVCMRKDLEWDVKTIHTSTPQTFLKFGISRVRCISQHLFSSWVQPYSKLQISFFLSGVSVFHQQSTSEASHCALHEPCWGGLPVPMPDVSIPCELLHHWLVCPGQWHHNIPLWKVGLTWL